MTNIEFPNHLKNLLECSPLQSPIRAYADRVGEILTDNKLPFFPDYTDHGTEHINQVLETEVDLVPEAVWDNSAKCSRSCAVLNSTSSIQAAAHYTLVLL